MRGTSSRMILVGICAWISMCLLIAGWLPEINDSVSNIWLISGLMGLVSAVGLAEAIKSDIRQQEMLLSEYMQAAMTDGLTGLANRQALDRALSAALKSYNQGRGQLCLVMIDIDHFKSFNDQHGHQAGDAVLRFMSGKMTDFFNGKGMPARYGGEEFAVMLPNYGIRDADRLADEFRQRMRSGICEFRDQSFQVTISAGVTEARPGDTPDTLLRRADLALYAAKKMGRDCIWVADDNVPHIGMPSLDRIISQTPAKVLEVT